MQTLVVPLSIWTQVIAHLGNALPNEGCGLLAGSGDRDDAWHVTAFFPGTNVLGSPHRYRMDSGEVVKAFRSMRENGLKLMAIVHSHPKTTPIPSRVDREDANYPQAAMLIVSFRDNQTDMAAWCIYGRASTCMRRIALRIETGY